MKKFFESIGLITLVCCSFWYTEKTTTVLKENDEIMIQIKQSKEEEQITVTEAFLEDDKMIPGIHGEEIDVEKSYIKMKEIGYFDSSFFVYKEVSPKILMKQNFDKYIISGNKEKKSVSLLFLIEKNTKKEWVNSLLSILKNKEISADFFVDGNFLEANNDLMYDIVNKGHKLGNLSYDHDYTNASFLWLDAVLKKLNKQKEGYCLLEKENKNALNICSMYKNHVLLPSYILENDAYITVKKNLSAGNLIAINVNSSTINEISLIIDFIHYKGYDIKLLQNHLEE